MPYIVGTLSGSRGKLQGGRVRPLVGTAKLNTSPAIMGHSPYKTNFVCGQLQKDCLTSPLSRTATFDAVLLFMSGACAAVIAGIPQLGFCSKEIHGIGPW